MSETATTLTAQRLFSQVEAARYLGISPATFRQHVHVEPVAVGRVGAGQKPILRYPKEELDAVVDRWKSARRSA